MIQNMANHNLNLLVYGIREIVEVANKIKKFDPTLELIWENIGDPVAKGWPVPPFLKAILSNEIARPDNRSFGYTHSRGNIKTREWAAEYSRQFSPSSTITAEDILFTNGLGSAIGIIYQMLGADQRILMPSPTYPTHASFESFASGQPPIFYKLDLNNNWEPDIADIENQIKNDSNIVGITVINPNNPTGAVYSKDVLEKIISLAEQYKLFIISDEIYFRMVFAGNIHTHVSELAHNRVPLVVMRGLSKDIPWPGGRCGWIEFHNTHLSPEFKIYSEALKQRVLLEVCAGTLPQQILPAVYSHPDFSEWNKNYNAELKIVADDVANILRSVPELIVNNTHGAFYMMPRFVAGCLKSTQTLPIKNYAVKKYIEGLTFSPDFPLDKRFTYYLLALTGIVCIPASDFFSDTPGFRVTTLERNPEIRKKTYSAMVKAIQDYLQS